LRYGNKSVVSEVIDDDKMPHTKDGRVLDVLVNLLAITNRTTAEVIIELFVTGAAYQTQLQMRNMKTLKEREKLLFDFIKTFNEGQAASFYSGYKKLDTAGKKAYIDDAMYGTILIHQPPIGETTPMFYRCMYALEKFPYLKEDDLYINKWGREIKVLNKTWVGTMYCVKSLTLLVVILIENYTNCWEISIEYKRSTTIESDLVI
jgi:DNA-directed RNA polymerase beta subunit